ncbi:MAG TPA: chitooligosaccharide deacetylase, partial [Clostridiales bacterium]|nr:chitooligosaccharide deacetylase [Clostridiales bacterium]
EAGHEIGNHSNKHPHIAKMSKAQVKDEIMECHHKVKELLGIDMVVFRPPYGEYNNTVINTSRELGYDVIQWSVDSLDWKDYTGPEIIRRVVDNKKMTGGAIVLMHTGAKYTADALDDLISKLEGKGYKFATVSELIYKENYYIDHEGKQIKKDVASN